MLKVKPTTRKFYDKWMYKVTLVLSGVSVLRQIKLEDLDTQLQHLEYKNPYSLIKKAIDNRDNLVAFANCMLGFQENEWAKRIESSSIDIYTNNTVLYNKLKTEFAGLVDHCFEPENPELLQSTSSVIVKKLPHGKYKYKVFLLPHKMKDVNDKHMYIEWLESRSDKILLSEAVKKWFIATMWNWDRRYILVEDEPTLLMLKLRAADVVGRIHDYVIVE